MLCCAQPCAPKLFISRIVKIFETWVWLKSTENIVISDRNGLVYLHYVSFWLNSLIYRFFLKYPQSQPVLIAVCSFHQWRIVRLNREEMEIVTFCSCWKYWPRPRCVLVCHSDGSAQHSSCRGTRCSDFILWYHLRGSTNADCAIVSMFVFVYWQQSTPPTGTYGDPSTSKRYIWHISWFSLYRAVRKNFLCCVKCRWL